MESLVWGACSGNRVVALAANTQRLTRGGGPPSAHFFTHCCQGFHSVPGCSLLPGEFTPFKTAVLTSGFVRNVTCACAREHACVHVYTHLCVIQGN